MVSIQRAIHFGSIKKYRLMTAVLKLCISSSSVLRDRAVDTALILMQDQSQRVRGQDPEDDPARACGQFINV